MARGDGNRISELIGRNCAGRAASGSRKPPSPRGADSPWTSRSSTIGPRDRPIKRATSKKSAFWNRWRRFARRSSGQGTRLANSALTDSLSMLIDAVAHDRPDVIVNLCEEFGGTSAGEIYVAGLLETFKIPYTGSPPECLALRRDKARTKWLYGRRRPADAAIPADRPRPAASREAVRRVACRRPACSSNRPVKTPASASITTVSSPIGRRRSAEPRLFATDSAPRWSSATSTAGNSISASSALPEPQVLPLAEIEFHVGPGKLRWPIVTYQGKWDIEGVEDHGHAAAVLGRD